MKPEERKTEKKVKKRGKMTNVFAKRNVPTCVHTSARSTLPAVTQSKTFGCEKDFHETSTRNSVIYFVRRFLIRAPFGFVFLGFKE